MTNIIVLKKEILFNKEDFLISVGLFAQLGPAAFEALRLSLIFNLIRFKVIVSALFA